MGRDLRVSKKENLCEGIFFLRDSTARHSIIIRMHRERERECVREKKKLQVALLVFVCWRFFSFWTLDFWLWLGELEGELGWVGLGWAREWAWNGMGWDGIGWDLECLLACLYRRYFSPSSFFFLSFLFIFLKPYLTYFFLIANVWC
ncbi:hypothetical protein BGZ57DRAFT_372585 [Hyaloscypha finlandica]|nr:hypothetical protein BGZ57DRAFT_372585 [Hyaloscypha finlandica]